MKYKLKPATAETYRAFWQRGYVVAFIYTII
jgi:hypothetical protein